MPKLPVDYNRTIIYKICCKNPEITDIYIGHTTDLTKRRNQHKTSCCNENDSHYNLYVYQFIRDNGGWDNWDIVAVEELQLETKNQALQQERFWLEELKASLNKIVPSRTQEESRKNWRENNPDYNKEKITCDVCKKCVVKQNFNRHLKTKIHMSFVSPSQT